MFFWVLSVLSLPMWEPQILCSYKKTFHVKHLFVHETFGVLISKGLAKIWNWPLSSPLLFLFNANVKRMCGALTSYSHISPWECS